MSPSVESVVVAHEATSPLEAFSAAIARTKTGPLYSAGLAIVAFAMVLLPLLYLALIALTGWGQEEDKRRSQEVGFNAHLVKPVDPNALQELLARPGLADHEPKP